MVLSMATVAGYRDFMLTPFTLIQRSRSGILYCFEEVRGCPSLVRTNCGTENIVRAERNNDLAGERAHRYNGPSTGKQRIEAWWSYFRKKPFHLMD